MESGPLPAVDLAQNSLGSIKPLRDVVAVDLETTGLHSAEECVIGIGVCFGDTRMDQHRYVRPTAAIAEAVRLGERRGFAKEIHGIDIQSSEFLDSAVAWDEAKALIPPEHVLVCHNLRHEERYVETPHGGYCTMEMAQHLGFGVLVLSELHEQLGMGPVAGAHNALVDAQATFRVFSRLSAMMSAEDLGLMQREKSTSVLSNLPKQGSGRRRAIWTK